MSLEKKVMLPFTEEKNIRKQKYNHKHSCSIKAGRHHHHQNTPSNSSSALGAFSPSTLLYCSLDLILRPLGLELGRKQCDFPQGPAPLKDGTFIQLSLGGLNHLNTFLWFHLKHGFFHLPFPKSVLKEIQTLSLNTAWPRKGWFW